MRKLLIGLCLFVAASAFASDCSNLINDALKDMKVLSEVMLEEKHLEEIIRITKEEGKNTTFKELQLEEFKRLNLAIAKAKAQASIDEAQECLNL
jgi:hypothetical protein